MPFNRFRHPEGTDLPALERNILKYRGFEMLLLLFYVEELKGMIVGAISATGYLRCKAAPRIEPATKNKFKKAITTLVEDGVFSQDESAEIAKLVDTRNIVAHELHKMTFDVSRDTWAREVLAIEKAQYDYRVLERIKYFIDQFEGRTQSKYVFELSLDSVLFRSAEKTYSRELKSLKKKITSQYGRRRKQLASLKSQLSLQGTEFVKQELHPAHPANIGRNGLLTKRGVEICFRLFDHGKSPTAVAYLMYISVRAAKKRHRQWLKAGGRKRQGIEL
jgi:hypothetical protein